MNNSYNFLGLNPSIYFNSINVFLNAHDGPHPFFVKGSVAVLYISHFIYI